LRSPWPSGNQFVADVCTDRFLRRHRNRPNYRIKSDKDLTVRGCRSFEHGEEARRGVVGGARRTAAPLTDPRLSPIRVLQFACWSRIGTTALTVVRPTTESISSRPPICCKRSRMLANPTPRVGAFFWPIN